MMTTHQYTNPFAELQTLPDEERVYEETLFRLRLGELIHRERVAQVSAHLDVIFRIFKALGKTQIELFG